MELFETRFFREDLDHAAKRASEAVKYAHPDTPTTTTTIRILTSVNICAYRATFLSSHTNRRAQYIPSHAGGLRDTITFFPRCMKAARPRCCRSRQHCRRLPLSSASFPLVYAFYIYPHSTQTYTHSCTNTSTRPHKCLITPCVTFRALMCAYVLLFVR